MTLTSLVGVLIILSVLLLFVYIMLQLIETMVNTHLHTTSVNIIYLLMTRQFSHFLEKRKLVKGDLIVIRFRGKFRKAYIKDIAYLYSETRVQITFDESSLNTKDLQENWYPLSRIILPEFLGKTAKLLFSENGV